MSHQNQEATRNCFLHIGAPKTGSTALQRFLAVNHEMLKRQNLLYPMSALCAMGHHDIAFLTGGGYPEWATPQKSSLTTLVRDLSTEIHGWKGAVVLSSENFYLLSNPLAVRRALSESGIDRDFFIKVVVYVRPQDEMHISWFNQLVKAQGYCGTLDQSISENHTLLEYDKKIEEWADVFSHENILVRRYDTLGRLDVRRDFLELVGVSGTQFEWTDDNSNERINKDILEFQRYVNRLPLTFQEKRRFHKQLIALTTATASLDLFDDSPLLTTARRREILSSYASGNSQVARTYLGRQKLFDDKLLEEPKTSRNHGGLTIEKLSYILGWILADIAKH